MIRLETSWMLALPVLGLLFLWWRQQREDASARRTAYFELWEKASEGAKLWDRWQWTRSQWSRLFLWLACLAGALAATKPAWVGPGGASYRLVIDRSASMRAKTRGGVSRQEEAIAQLGAFLRERRSGNRCSLWTLGQTLEPIVSETDDFSEIETALARLTPKPESADPRKLAGQFPASDNAATTIFFSDARNEGDWISWGVGDAIANAGIASVRAEGVWPKKMLRIHVELRNFSAQAQSRTLRVISPSGKSREVPVALAAQEKKAFDLDWERDAGGEVQLRLEPGDEFSADDEAALWLAPRPQAPLVLLQPAASDEISPLTAAAAAWAEQAEISLEKIADPAAAPAGAVLLVDGGRLEALPARLRGAILFGTQIPGLLGEPALARPKLVDWKRDHPLLRGLGFDFLACTQAWSVLGEASPLVMSAEGPLLVGIDQGAFRALAATFRLADSNLPVQAQFPVLLGRAYAWVLGNPRDGEPRLVWESQRVPFLDPEESSLEDSPARGPDKMIPQGPGHAREFLAPCLWAAALFLTLALFLGWPFR